MSKRLRLFKTKKAIILLAFAIILIVLFSLVEIIAHQQNKIKEKAILAAKDENINKIADVKAAEDAKAKKKAQEVAQRTTTNKQNKTETPPQKVAQEVLNQQNQMCFFIGMM